MPFKNRASRTPRLCLLLAVSLVLAFSIRYGEGKDLRKVKKPSTSSGEFLCLPFARNGVFSKTHVSSGEFSGATVECLSAYHANKLVDADVCVLCLPDEDDKDGKTCTLTKHKYPECARDKRDYAQKYCLLLRDCLSDEHTNLQVCAEKKLKPWMEDCKPPEKERRLCDVLGECGDDGLLQISQEDAKENNAASIMLELSSNKGINNVTKPINAIIPDDEDAPPSTSRWWELSFLFSLCVAAAVYSYSNFFTMSTVQPSSKSTLLCNGHHTSGV